MRFSRPLHHVLVVDASAVSYFRAIYDVWSGSRPPEGAAISIPLSFFLSPFLARSLVSANFETDLNDRINE